ncbi:MAG: hypothetical protein KDI79_00880 [Anaerolineae bacterium]|nr:hypothetical protein [Anaerolineae bacterium]
MKQSNTCPKCQSTDIIHIPGKSQKAGYDVGENVRTGRANFFDALAMVDMYVCGDCGYIEDWVASPEDIQKIKRKFGKQTE